ncbi:hypothetical protein C8F01DRAFT_1128538 [Mycena amicta]|nr:hypothetical protein C8F01DRAFT_1128538 [Mycena amicta]
MTAWARVKDAAPSWMFSLVVLVVICVASFPPGIATISLAILFVCRVGLLLGLAVATPGNNEFVASLVLFSLGTVVALFEFIPMTGWASVGLIVLAIVGNQIAVAAVVIWVNVAARKWIAERASQMPWRKIALDWLVSVATFGLICLASYPPGLAGVFLTILYIFRVLFVSLLALAFWMDGKNSNHHMVLSVLFSLIVDTILLYQVDWASLGATWASLGAIFTVTANHLAVWAGVLWGHAAARKFMAAWLHKVCPSFINFLAVRCSRIVAALLPHRGHDHSPIKV